MKIGLIYGHVASNLGDLCINRGVISLLNNAFGEYKLHVVFRDPNEEYFNLA